MSAKENVETQSNFNEQLQSTVDEHLILPDEYRCGMDFVAGNVDSIKCMLRRVCERMNYVHLQSNAIDARRAQQQVEQLIDDVFSEVVIEKCEHIWNKYIEGIGNRRGFMFAQFQLYARKWFQTFRLHQSRFKLMGDHTAEDSNIDWIVDDGTLPNDDDAPIEKRNIKGIITEFLAGISGDDEHANAALFDSEEVILFLDSLSERDERIVRMHACYSMGFEEISNKIGGGPSTIRVAYHRAIQQLKELAARRESGNVKEHNE